MRQIGIIGGGASGMMAAIAAANTSIKDTEITILERRDRIGRKILATGNGKCNLGNTDFSPKRDYRSHDPYRLPSSLRVSRHPIRSAFLRNEVFI